MRSFNHWTPRYLFNRLQALYFAKKYPHNPWLTISAVKILDSYLKTSDIGLEFGSGKSTVWLAKRVARLHSVEHDSEWQGYVRKMLLEENITNVTYEYLPIDVTQGDCKNESYVRVTEKFEAGSLDFCLIDGTYRDLCTLNVIDKLVPGGILILDNANWYLPHFSHSPSSRKPSDGPDGEIWEQVYLIVSGWRKIWTSNGVTDTALYFKPIPR